MKKENKKELLIYLIIILAVILVRTYIVTPVRVNGSSMNETLKDGDILLLNKYEYKFKEIKRFDIVVIHYKNEKFIKRVIGLPGETLEFKDNILYINGKKIEETFLTEETADFIYEGEIGKNCYFVMGDNRDDSLDSRFFDCFDEKTIMGKVTFSIFPFGSIN